MGPGRVEVQKVPEPVPRPDEAVVRVEATGICGSDLAGFQGRSSRRQPPLILGHEVVGRIETSPSDARLLLGQRVVVNPLQTCGECSACRHGADNQCRHWRLLGMDGVPGGFAEYVAVGARNVVPIPDQMPVEVAALVEPLANTVHVFRLFGPVVPERLLILGAGTQGILALLAARYYGIAHVAMSERDVARRELARELGAEVCWSPEEGDLTQNVRRWAPDGTDIVLEAVGTSDTRKMAVDTVRNGGKVILLGLHEQDTTLDFSRVVRREVTLQGSFAYTRHDFEESLRLLISGTLELRRFVETLPLSRGQEAFLRAAQGLGKTLKLLLTP